MQVAEPSEDKAILMVRGVASMLEKHHRVQVLDEALEAAVRLSHRYIPARQLPDKAVSLLDTACARVAISQHAVPPQLEDCRRTIEAPADRAGDHRPRGSRRHQRRRAPEGRGREARVERAAPRVARGAVEGRARAGGARPRDSREAPEGKRARGRHGQQARAGGGGAEGRRRRAGRRKGDAGGTADDCSASWPISRQKLSALQGESPLILPSVDEQAVGVGRAGLDRRAGRPHGEERDRDAC